MKVVCAINGSITAESCAMYALHYAKVQGLDLVLFHLENHKDDLQAVSQSAKRILAQAELKGTQAVLISESGHIKERIYELMERFHVDIIFCATRKSKKIITDSFSDYLLKLNLATDIAVVHIVQMGASVDVNSMLLAIREDHLSIKKFGFFASMARSYESRAEIYSVTPLSKSKLSRLELGDTKKRLEGINFNLRHYTKLAHLLRLPLHIKHDFSLNEDESIMERAAKSNTQLLVIGAKRLSFFSGLGREKPIEHLMRHISVNTIAFYPKED